MIVKVIITIIMSLKLTNGNALKGIHHGFKDHLNNDSVSILESLNINYSIITKEATLIDNLFMDTTKKEYFKDNVVNKIKDTFLNVCYLSVDANT